jgi:flagellar hook-associated protein 3 FlgL
MRISTNEFFREKISMINGHYEKLSKLMEQQSKGDKLLAASDDPILASRITTITDYIDELNAYKQNELIANNRNRMFQSSMDVAVSATDQIKQIISRASSDLVSDNERATMAATLSSHLANLLNSANTRDSNGDYIYSGFNSSSQPYVIQGGSYQYQGTIDTTTINIGPNSSVLYAESGFDVFGNIPLGNGTFIVSASSGNTGFASTTPGNVVNPASYVPDNYTISFMDNGSGQLVYTVFGASSGQVIPPPPASIPAQAPQYVNGGDITFNGMTLNISGTPNIGDTFQVAPSKNQDVFDSLQQLINLLNTPTANNQTKIAAFHQSISQFSATFDQVFNHFNNYRSEVGSRGQLISSQVKLNEDLRLSQEDIKKSLSEISFTEVTGDIAKETLFLKATLGAYTQIQQTLLDMLKR